jgi:hypothetical protein
VPSPFFTTMKKFTIKLDTYKYIQDLSDQELGQLFRSLYDYHINDVTIAPSGLKILHTMFVDGFEKDKLKSEKMRDNGLKNTKQTKAKESKSKQNQNDNQRVTIEQRRQTFAEGLKTYVDKYGRDMLNDFYRYWSEPNQSNTKLKFEMEKTWALNLRLETWANRNKQFGNNKPQEREIIIPKI